MVYSWSIGPSILGMVVGPLLVNVPKSYSFPSKNRLH